MKRKYMAVLLALLLAAAMIPMTVSADDTDDTRQTIDDLKGQQQQNADDQQVVQAEKDQVDSQIAEIQGELDELNAEIDAKEAEVGSLQTEVDAKQREIDAKQKEIDAQQAAIDDREAGIASRLRTMYKNGSIGFFDVLLNSGDLSEFASNLSMVQRIFESDQNTLTELEKEYDSMQGKLKELQAAMDELTEAQNALVQQQYALEVQQADAQVLEGELQERAAELQAQLEEFQAQADAIAAELATQEALYEEQLRAQRGGGDPSDPYYVSENVSFIWPTNGVITSYFGGRQQIGGIPIDTTYHGALDIANAQGTPIYAACSGVVTATMDYSPWGNYVMIYHGDGFSTAYWHLMDGGVVAYEGQYVSQGELIGYMGMTGFATGPHLHFEVRINGTAVDPLLYLP